MREVQERGNELATVLIYIYLCKKCAYLLSDRHTLFYGGGRYSKKVSCEPLWRPSI